MDSGITYLDFECEHMEDEVPSFPSSFSPQYKTMQTVHNNFSQPVSTLTDDDFCPIKVRLGSQLSFGGCKQSPSFQPDRSQRKKNSPVIGPSSLLQHNPSFIKPSSKPIDEVAWEETEPDRESQSEHWACFEGFHFPALSHGRGLAQPLGIKLPADVQITSVAVDDSEQPKSLPPVFRTDQTSGSATRTNVIYKEQLDYKWHGKMINPNQHDSLHNIQLIHPEENNPNHLELRLGEGADYQQHRRF